ncbi:MAG: protein kinase [Acidobacteriota bacterium]
MTPERWQKIDSLLQAALEREPDERARFLDSACEGDDELRREVESLLSSNQTESFLQSPALEQATALIAHTESYSLLGQRLGPYRIISQLGAGGMGEVYLAHDSRLKRKVALKILPPYFTKDEQRLRRFQQEARAASALNHPNIITIFDIGEVDSIHYIATEYIDGETLRQQMTRKMKIDEVLDVVVQAASALEAAHQAGIVHRDIKPENIMVRPDGYVKVLDFGLAKPRHGAPGASDAETTVMGVNTEPGVVMGTVNYMSPEQARGREMDCRTDVFSLGAVVYEMVSGRRPFEGETTSDVMAAILGKEPAPLVSYDPDTPGELNRIVMKALKKEKAERYQTAGELLNDLKNLKRDTDSGAAMAGSYSRDQRPALRRWLATALTLLIIVASGLGLYQLFRGDREAERIPSPVVKSIAVLPFKPIVADSGDEALEMGMADTLIARLGNIREIIVRPTSAVRRYSALDQDALAAGREQRVDAVLDGSIHKSGERVRVTVRLVRVADGQQLWADRFDEKWTDIFTVQDSISTKVAAVLALRLSGKDRDSLTKRYTDNTEAYQAYLRGRYHASKFTKEGFDKGIEQINRAIAIDPNYALAYEALAYYYFAASEWTMSAREAMPKARDAARKAIQLDGTLAGGHVWLGAVSWWYDWNWSDAEREYQRAIELNPNDATAHEFYGFYLMTLGRFEQAVAESKRAQELDPLSLEANTFLGQTLYFAGRYEEAVRQLRKTIDLDPNYWFAYLALSRVYEETKQLDEMMATIQKARQKESAADSQLMAALGRGYALMGRRREAWMTVEELKKRSKRGLPDVGAYYIAMIYAALGEKDQAFEWLERGYQERTFFMTWLNVDPQIAPLRSDPRFADLVRRVGLPDAASGK